MSVAQDKPSTNSIVVLVLGIVSFLGPGILTGIPAWILGKKELAAIDQGSAPSSGRTMATIGMWLGIAATVLMLIGFVLFVLAMTGMMAVGTWGIR